MNSCVRCTTYRIVLYTSDNYRHFSTEWISNRFIVHFAVWSDDEHVFDIIFHILQYKAMVYIMTGAKI